MIPNTHGIDYEYYTLHAGQVTRRLVPYLMCEQTGDVCDFYWKREDGELIAFQDAEHHAARLSLCANKLRGVREDDVKHGLLLKAVLWFYRLKRRLGAEVDYG